MKITLKSFLSQTELLNYSELHLQISHCYTKEILNSKKNTSYWRIVIKLKTRVCNSMFRKPQSFLSLNPNFFFGNISLDGIFMVASLKFHPHLMNYQVIIIQLLRYISSLPYFITSVPGYVLPFTIQQNCIRFSDLCLILYAIVKHCVWVENT
jgi:hypothetical protein